MLILYTFVLFLIKFRNSFVTFKKHCQTGRSINNYTKRSIQMKIFVLIIFFITKIKSLCIHFPFQLITDSVFFNVLETKVRMMNCTRERISKGYFFRDICKKPRKDAKIYVIAESLSPQQERWRLISRRFIT